MGYIVSDGVIYSGGSGGGGGGSTTFSGLTDVVIDSATLASGQVPVYNAATNKWENADVTAPSNLTDLGDVNITSPSNGQIVRYDATSGKFIASDEQTGDYVAVSQILSTGTKIAGIIVDGTETEVFAPTPPSISITQIQSTGTKIATITVDSSNTDIYAPEGGGSGGHTILDDDGTSLTQRSNLQFKGTYSSDDSTNEITEVNIVRSMTKAEFDLLSSAEKQGIINITDVTDVEADSVAYDNTSSGLTATDAQAAIDELSDAIPTVLNDSGTSLTRRPNLQFKGAYSEDNSADETTEVNVARTMTLAEFEELSDAEKKGFINVKDETSGSDDKFQPVIYSTEEREIGVWTDGKPLYEETIEITTFSSGTFTKYLDDLNCDFVHITDGFWSLSGGATIRYLSFYLSSAYYGYVNLDYSNSQWKLGGGIIGYTPVKLCVTIRYTKTTDTPGSGTWTPQGVPSHHYSTDEQIIGTWIDGKTLYEKTFKVDNASIDTAHATEIADLTASNIETLVCVLHSVGYLHAYGVYINENRLSIGYDPTNKKLVAGQSYTQQYTATDILTTIRYTKSST